MADTPGLTEPSPGQGGVQKEIPPETAAEMAMDSGKQTLAGSAQGVGSVHFDEPGVFEIGDEADVKDRQEAAPGAHRDDPAKPTPDALRARSTP